MATGQIEHEKNEDIRGVIERLDSDGRTAVVTAMFSIVCRDVTPTMLVNQIELPSLESVELGQRISAVTETIRTIKLGAASRIEALDGQMLRNMHLITNGRFASMQAGLPFGSFIQLPKEISSVGRVAEAEEVDKIRGLEYDINVLTGLAIAHFSGVPVSMAWDFNPELPAHASDPHTEYKPGHFAVHGVFNPGGGLIHDALQIHHLVA